ncbi:MULTISPECIES: hypothetical protein [Cryobacterium]|uniref:Uncharacterized protein n=1 Tax=Cryobacterium breve TaxID=1259258 RepID=A0ABY2IVN0_9MICO|nr:MULTISPECIES: hypothetical protein [Cryobacterium]TFC93935.1 hypothetical protein E3T20_09300 [Cryobacterium sp. TmT3-12]TFC95677.1 hypothetical protein E3O65_14370 [Cryobacterium breve]
MSNTTNKIRAWQVALGFAAAGSLILAGIAPASAVEDPTESTAQLIGAVAPDQGEVLFGTDSSTAIDVESGQIRVSVPTDPSQPIIVSATDDAAKGQFAISLPTEVNVGEATVATDGTVVYTNATGGADAAVQVLDGGTARIQTITNDTSGPHEFTYNFAEGYTPVEAEDGSIAVVGDGGFSLFEAAWARDANGADVATRYEIRGNSLVQVLEPTADTAYPIVADPAWNWHAAAWGAKFNKAETRDISNAAGSAAVCLIMAKASPVFAATCAGVATYYIGSASLAKGRGMCLFVSVVPAPIAMSYKDGDCY